MPGDHFAFGQLWEFFSHNIKKCRFNYPLLQTKDKRVSIAGLFF